MTSSYYDTLSSGQLPATAAAIVEQKRFVNGAMRELGLSDVEGVTTQVSVLPETAVIKVKVTATDADTAVAMADELPRQANQTVDQLLAPYHLTVLGSAEETAAQSSLGTGQWVGIIVLTAIVVGLAVQQLVQQVSRARRRPAGADRG